MANFQPVQTLASMLNERSHEVRNALLKMGKNISESDTVDVDDIDQQQLKKQIHDDLPDKLKVGTSKSSKEDK